jgi:predicted transcriptional regulator
MLAVKGIYDGKSVKLLDKLTDHRKYKVVVTFLEEIETTDEELRDFTSQTTGLDFWNDPKEDIYQDYLKIKQK